MQRKMPGRRQAWLKKFKGNLRTLDVVGLWRAAGLVIEQKDDEKFAVQCPNRVNHSDPEAFGGTVLYKRPGEYPIFHCGRTSAGTVSSALKRRCCPSVLSLWTSFVNHSILTAMMMAISPRSSPAIANCPT